MHFSETILLAPFFRCARGGVGCAWAGVSAPDTLVGSAPDLVLHPGLPPACLLPTWLRPAAWGLLVHLVFGSHGDDAGLPLFGVVVPIFFWGGG